MVGNEKSFPLFPNPTKILPRNRTRLSESGKRKKVGGKKSAGISPIATSTLLLLRKPKQGVEGDSDVTDEDPVTAESETTIEESTDVDQCETETMNSKTELESETERMDDGKIRSRGSDTEQDNLQWKVKNGTGATEEAESTAVGGETEDKMGNKTGIKASGNEQWEEEGDGVEMEQDAKIDTSSKSTPRTKVHTDEDSTAEVAKTEVAPTEVFKTIEPPTWEVPSTKEKEYNVYTAEVPKTEVTPSEVFTATEPPTWEVPSTKEKEYNVHTAEVPKTEVTPSEVFTATEPPTWEIPSTKEKEYNVHTAEVSKTEVNPSEVFTATEPPTWVVPSTKEKEYNVYTAEVPKTEVTPSEVFTATEPPTWEIPSTKELTETEVNTEKVLKSDAVTTEAFKQEDPTTMMIQDAVDTTEFPMTEVVTTTHSTKYKSPTREHEESSFTDVHVPEVTSAEGITQELPTTNEFSDIVYTTEIPIAELFTMEPVVPAEIKTTESSKEHQPTVIMTQDVTTQEVMAQEVMAQEVLTTEMMPKEVKEKIVTTNTPYRKLSEVSKEMPQEGDKREEFDKQKDKFIPCLNAKGMICFLLLQNLALISQIA